MFPFPARRAFVFESCDLYVFHELYMDTATAFIRTQSERHAAEIGTADRLIGKI